VIRTSTIALGSACALALLAAAPAAAGPAGGRTGDQHEQTIPRMALVCENDRSTECPAEPADAGYFIEENQEGRVYHAACNGNQDPEGLLDPVPCVPNVVATLAGRMTLIASEIPADPDADCAADPDCINIQLEVLLEVPYPKPQLKLARIFRHEEGFLRDATCQGNDDDGGVLLGDWFAFRNRDCAVSIEGFNSGINFEGLMIPGNPPHELPEGQDVGPADPKLVDFEAALVALAASRLGLPAGSVLPTTLIDEADPGHDLKPGNALRLRYPEDVVAEKLKDKGARREVTYPLTIRFAAARTGPADAVECNDGVDNDGDALTDAADPGCAHPLELSERSPLLPCDDGIDNDGDGRIDAAADPVCVDPAQPSESSECQDGLENDGDALIDFDGGASLNGGIPLAPADPQCASAAQPREDGKKAKKKKKSKNKS
jgi:hypothetical protein